MTKLKKSVIACTAVAAVLLSAFIAVLTVFSVKKNAGDAAWKKVDYIAVSSVGELKVNYSDYTRNKTIAVDGRSVDVTRYKSEGDNRGHFVCGNNGYYIIIIFGDGKPTGFLYSDDGEIPPDFPYTDGGEMPTFIEKLNFAAA